MRLGHKVLSGAKLFEHFWSENHNTSFSYVTQVLHGMEPYFAQLGKNYPRLFIDAILKGVAFNAKSFLWFTEPSIGRLFKEMDVREAMLRINVTMARKANPEQPSELLKFWNSSDGMRNVLFLSMIDPDYTRAVPPCDYENTIITLAQYMPFRFGGPPIEEYTLHCQYMSPFDVIEESERPRIDNGIFYVGDVRYGRVEPFYDFLKRKRIKLHKYVPPNSNVVVMERQYKCPLRGRVVLRRGCAYGAPFCLYTYHFPAWPKIRAKFSSIIREVKYPGKSIYHTIEKRHYALLKRLQNTFSVKYHTWQNRITINGKHLTSGTQAKILSRIVKLHAQEGRRDFERREFTADRNLVSDPVDTGFVIRLNRIAERLSRVSPQLRIVRNGQGKFYFKAGAKVEYSEM